MESILANLKAKPQAQKRKEIKIRLVNDPQIKESDENKLAETKDSVGESKENESKTDQPTNEQESTQQEKKDSPKPKLKPQSQSFIVNKAKNYEDLAPEYKSLLQKIKNAKQMSYKEKTDEELLKEKREMEKQKEQEEEAAEEAEEAFDIEQIKQEDKKSKRKTRKKFVDVEMMEANAEEQLEIKKQREERKTKKMKMKVQKDYMENMAQKQKIQQYGENFVTLVETIRKQLPETQVVKMPLNKYYLNNRNAFTKMIDKLFKDNNYDFAKERENVSCVRDDSKPFSLLSHQKIVRDYLNIYSPYRGLLLYHGLGAGKTCSSIGIAEGMQSEYEVIVMTPASLQMNYRMELMKCGNPLFKKNNHWEFISIDLTTEEGKKQADAYSTVLGVALKTIKKYKGVYLTNPEKSPNFHTFKPEEQAILNAQIMEMIEHKYKFLNYNGMRTHNLNEMEERALLKSKNKTNNPFTNKVLIIDEVHNFVSRIVNKLNKKDALAHRLYEHIMRAENCRLVFLSGTPIINYPNEIAVLFNMLRGYINRYMIQLDTSKTKGVMTEKRMIELVKKFSYKNKIIKADKVEYKSGGKLYITCNPYGFSSTFRRTKDGDAYNGVVKIQNRTYRISDIKYIKGLVDYLESPTNKITVMKKPNGKLSLTLAMFKALPDDLDTFRTKFIDSRDNTFNNSNLFRKRILGLTSYFRSAQEKLLPRFNPEEDIHIVNVEMSDHQLGVYESARIAERAEAKRNKKRAKQKGDDIYQATTSTYRIFSRLYCNFVFPETMYRPLPSGDEEIKENMKLEKLNENMVDLITPEEQAKAADGGVELDDEAEIKKETSANITLDYSTRINNAIQRLKTEYVADLRMSNLKKCSPKFLQILKNITNEENIGSHLIYSQFRTLEGIELLKTVLEVNGFERFSIVKNDLGLWELGKMDPEKPKFLLYTGTETAEEKEILRNIFNGNWESAKIMGKIREQLEELDKLRPNYDNKKIKRNMLGELIKIFMITSSGAEGITLKNVRFVHITEPYWHPVRQEQIIGRAVRICSHNELEEELRDVKVFVYLMTFSDKQVYGDPNGEKEEDRKPLISSELRVHDQRKIKSTDPKKHNYVTTDEALYEISSIKENINKEILKLIKESSIDCRIHSRNSESKEKLQCYYYDSVDDKETFTYNANINDDDVDKVAKQNIVKQKIKMQTLSLGGKKYAYIEDPLIIKAKKIKALPKGFFQGELYDASEYMEGITDNLLGYIITEQDKGKLKYKKLGKEKKNKKKFMTKQQLKQYIKDNNIQRPTNKGKKKLVIKDAKVKVKVKSNTKAKQSKQEKPSKK